MNTDPTTMSLMEIIKAYWPVPVCSFVIALIATPICRRVAIKRNIVDRPDDWLKPHSCPIPYLGGVAIYVAWAVAIIFGMWWLDHLGTRIGEVPIRMTDRVMMGVLIGGTLIMGLGLFDDLRLASPRAKLVGTIIVAFVLMLCGLGDDWIRELLARLNVHFGPDDRWLVWVYSIPVTVFIVVGACNAANLLDGLDGLCSGVLGIIALGFLVLAVHLQARVGWSPDNIRRVLIASAMMGAALGFLPYNRNPATIFMGDAGSMLLGFTAAVMILTFAESRTFRWMVGAIVVVGLPISDMALTLVRRWRAQRPLMLGDRSHFYDQLRDRGYSVKQVVVVSYVLAAVFAAVGCLAPIFLRFRYSVLAYALLAFLTLYAIKKFKMVRVDGPAGAGSDASRDPGH